MALEAKGEEKMVERLHVLDRSAARLNILVDQLVSAAGSARS